MSNKTMMKCGHSANAHDTKGNPVCAMCIGLRPGASEVDENPPSLDSRVAKCTCGSKKPSNPALAFFEYRINENWDRYYCGCMGWD